MFEEQFSNAEQLIRDVTCIPSIIEVYKHCLKATSQLVDSIKNAERIYTGTFVMVLNQHDADEPMDVDEPIFTSQPNVFSSCGWNHFTSHYTTNHQRNRWSLVRPAEKSRQTRLRKLKRNCRAGIRQTQVNVMNVIKTKLQ
jgi:hypothetical protein